MMQKSLFDHHVSNNGNASVTEGQHNLMEEPLYYMSVSPVEYVTDEPFARHHCNQMDLAERKTNEKNYKS
jgi:hypothetical protein